MCCDHKAWDQKPKRPHVSAVAPCAVQVVNVLAFQAHAAHSQALYTCQHACTHPLEPYPVFMQVLKQSNLSMQNSRGPCSFRFTQGWQHDQPDQWASVVIMSFKTVLTLPIHARCCAWHLFSLRLTETRMHAHTKKIQRGATCLARLKMKTVTHPTGNFTCSSLW